MSESIQIEVLKPFKVRLTPGSPVKEFEPGKTTLTPEEQKHWFIKGCKRERWVLADDDETAAPSVNDDMAAQLKKEEVQAKMLAIFPKLTEADLKADGVPTVAAIEKAIGEDVKAARIAEAWEVYQAQIKDKG